MPALRRLVLLQDEELRESPGVGATEPRSNEDAVRTIGAFVNGSAELVQLREPVAGLVGDQQPHGLEPLAEERRDSRPQLVETLIASRRQHASHNIWIAEVPDDTLRARAAELAGADPASLPLYGIPFAIKDNIDLAGLPTTAGCPAFAYRPDVSSPVVQALASSQAVPSAGSA